MDHRFRRNAPAGIQHTHSLGAPELVGGQGQQVNVHGLHVNGQMARRLDCVGVEQSACLPAQRSDLRDGLDGTDLVIGKHHRHQAGIRPQGLPDRLRRHHTVGRNIQQRNCESLLLQRLEGVEDCMVLKLGGEDMALALPGPQRRAGTQSLNIGLAAAGGKGNLPGGGVQIPGKNLPGLHQLLRRPLTGTVEAGGIGVNALEAGQHRSHGRIADGGGGRMIRVNLHGSFSLFPICFV